MSAAKTGRGRKGGEENSRKRVLSRGAKKGPTVSLKMNCSGTLVEWNVFSREIKPRLALLPSRHRLDRNKRETGERDCVPAVIMVQRISPINLIVLRPPFAPSARRTELSSKPFCYIFPPSILELQLRARLELLHICDQLRPFIGRFVRFVEILHRLPRRV